MTDADGITIRPAREADLAAIGALGADLMRVHYAFDRQRFMAPSGDPAAAYARFLAPSLSDDEALVLVAEARAGTADAVLAGYVFAAIEPESWKELRHRAGYIHDILVADGARGAGAGTRLLEAALAWVRDRGLPRVLLWTAWPNTRARALFEAHGFRPTMIEMTREV